MKNPIASPYPLIIRRSQLKAVVGLSPSTVDRLEAAGDFPPKRHYSTGGGVVGWDGQEVAQWVADKRNTRKEG